MGAVLDAVDSPPPLCDAEEGTEEGRGWGEGGGGTPQQGLRTEGSFTSPPCASRKPMARGAS